MSRQPPTRKVDSHARIKLAPSAAGHSWGRVQVFTPIDVGTFMAQILLETGTQRISLLDPGAGTGALTEAVLKTLHSDSTFERVTLVEIDPILTLELSEAHMMSLTKRGPKITILQRDLLEAARDLKKQSFSHVILNPPYARVTSSSDAGLKLKELGIKTSNFAAAFLWIAFDALVAGGTMVAIVPRILLSGANFSRLRTHLDLGNSLFRLHHYRDRKSVFDRDQVQQEVVIIGLQKGVRHASVKFSSSKAHPVNDNDPILSLPKDRIVHFDGESAPVVLIPEQSNGNFDTPWDGPPLISGSTQVSVGSVVDFRMRDHMVPPAADGIPLIGTELFGARGKPARALSQVRAVAPHVYPAGKYLVIRRISPPESRPRLQVASLDATGDNYAHGVAFENHVLVVHRDRSGLRDLDWLRLLEALRSLRIQRQVQERVSGTQINRSDITSLRAETQRNEHG